MKSTSNSMREAHDTLLRYLNETGTLPKTSGPFLKQAARRVIPIPLRSVVRRAATDLLIIRERRRALKVARCIPLQLHLGSARSPKAGWVNIDLFGDPVDLAWNLDRSLPFKNNSVDAIFHEHFLEHFTLQKGFALIQQCRQVLKPGGILRIGVPDAAAYVESYVQCGSGLIASARSGRPTPLLALQEVFYWYGHRTMYDFDTLALVCRAAGFDTVEQRLLGASRLTPCPDSEHRRLGTLYVEMVK